MEETDPVYSSLLGILQCNKVSSDHGAGPELEKEARKWSTKVAKETRSIRDYYRQMTILQNGRSIEKVGLDSLHLYLD